MPQVFKTAQEARESLLDFGFLTKGDQNLELCASMLVFLCNKPEFETQLKTVSAFIWSNYTGLDVGVKNKFSRSLAQLAQQQGFQVSTRRAEAPHPNTLTLTSMPSPGTMDIKLVGSYGDFYGLLRSRMFWKDSMDMEHGEYSHALQWLALAEQFGSRAPAFYAQLPNYASGAKKGKIPLWSYLADCFPPTKKADAELLSDTYRSPQVITRHLIGNAKPMDDHFVSFYLTYIYKARKLVSYDKTKTDGVKANYGSAPGHALETNRMKNWLPQSEIGKTGKAEVTRLDRDPFAEPRKAGKVEGVEMKFHGIVGQFWTRGDWGNVYFSE